MTCEERTSQDNQRGRPLDIVVDQFETKCEERTQWRRVTQKTPQAIFFLKKKNFFLEILLNKKKTFLKEILFKFII